MCSVPACSWKEESRCEKVSVPLEAPGKEAVNMSQNPVWMTMIIKLLFNSSSPNTKELGFRSSVYAKAPGVFPQQAMNEALNGGGEAHLQEP
ncbi:uncharacterized protein ACIQIH_012910 isoform 3-T3 [Cyanocitta cristata]